MKSTIDTLKVYLTGFGQIMFQENPLTGALFFAGLILGSYIMALGSILAILTSVVTAKLFSFDYNAISRGLYSFSAALVGAALPLFLEPGLITWLLVIAGAIMATLTHHLLQKVKIPPFTFPFVLTTWIVLGVSTILFPSLFKVNGEGISLYSSLLYAPLTSYGEVIFQGGVLSGVLFFLGVLISNPIAAIFGLGGGALSSLIAYLFGASPESVGLGLWGFNAVLCAILFSNKDIKAIYWSALAVIISLAISSLIVKSSITQLTFPFVAASWIVLSLQKGLKLYNK